MLGQYINGACVEGAGKPFNVVSPATEEVITLEESYCGENLESRGNYQPSTTRLDLAGGINET